MTYEEHFADLVKRGCNDRDAAIIAQSRADYDAVKNAPLAPRPTCGTCPLWLKAPESMQRGGKGICCLMPGQLFIGVQHPQLPEKHADEFCGQHPDMPAWIEKEWPKVRR